ncbi:TPA: hypothetical protein P0E30_003749 [Vibrio harveyi]|nr:hypothetical protein [Vibrio harveyi]
MTNSNNQTAAKMFIDIIERSHKIEALRQQERNLSAENRTAKENLTALLYREHGPEYATYVEKLVINVDNRKYHPELDPEDGEIMLTEVTYRDIEVNQ